jgi:hypothetical protein
MDALLVAGATVFAIVLLIVVVTIEKIFEHPLRYFFHKVDRWASNKVDAIEQWYSRWEKRWEIPKEH